MHLQPANTLTPALSRKRERERFGPLSPVLGGEGWGEGAQRQSPRGCSAKKRSISRDASGPLGSVYEPLALPPDQAWPEP
jgi:hypothetical protein